MVTRRLIHIFFLAVIAATAASASDQPSPRFRFDLSLFLTEPQQNVHLAFMGDDRLFVTIGEFRSNGLVFNLNNRQLEKSLPLGNCYVIHVWSTASGNLVVYCRDHFVVYDKDLQIRAELPLENWGSPIEVSPSGALFTLNAGHWGLDQAGKSTFFPNTVLMQAETLQLLQSNLPDDSGPVTDAGAIVSKPDGLYFWGFAGSESKLLIRFKSKSDCRAYTRILGPDRLVAWTCRARSPIVVNLAGAPIFTLSDTDGVVGATPSISGDRFLLVIQKETPSYAFKHAINPVGVLAGADIFPNLDVLRAYDQQSGKLLLELKWKLQPDDPIFGGFGEGVGALSRSGTLLAAIRGKSLEVYEIPKN
jgi:hypothetical protein